MFTIWPIWTELASPLAKDVDAEQLQVLGPAKTSLSKPGLSHADLGRASGH